MCEIPTLFACLLLCALNEVSAAPPDLSPLSQAYVGMYVHTAVGGWACFWACNANRGSHGRFRKLC